MSKRGIKPKWEIYNARCMNIYYKMMSRCHNPLNKDYDSYGGRGIFVCEEWISDRDKFCNYVMELPNFDNLDYTIDRINNDKGYEPGNVKFSTRKEQSRNTRRNSILTIDNIRYTAVEFSEKFGIDQDFIKDRLKLGFSSEEILLIPKGMKRKEFYKKEKQ